MSSGRSWEKFEKPAVRLMRGGVRVSVNPMGEITFDLGTYQAMGEPQAVSLMYEKRTETIGIEPADADVASAVMVRARHARTNRAVRSKPFFDKHGILPVTTVLIPYAYLEGNILILDMRTAVQWGKGWKKLEQAEERRVAAAEVRADRDRHRAAVRAEKERLRKEREKLHSERLRLRRVESELRREAVAAANAQRTMLK